jgi:hypothetical protein
LCLRKTLDDQEGNVSIGSDTSFSTLQMVLGEVDRSSNKLAKITSNDPEGKIFSTSPRRCERHDGTTLSNIPRSRADTRDKSTEDDVLLDISTVLAYTIKFDAYPLVAKFAVAIIRRPLNWKRHSANDQRPFDAELVHEGSSEEADQCEHNVVDSVGDVVCLGRSKTTTTQT